MGLRRTVEPVADAITIHTAKKQCEIGLSDTTHDTHLHRLIVGAVRDVERFTKRALITQTWELTQSRFPGWELALPRPPFQSVASIAYVDERGVVQTLAQSLYQVSSCSPAVLQPAYDQVWPATRESTLDAVKITFVAGYGADSASVPAEFQNLIAELVAFRFMNRGDVQGEMPKHIRWSLNSLRCGAMYDYYGIRQ
jgi:uncharacterized phiE125 gp8 family phage protein